MKKISFILALLLCAALFSVSASAENKKLDCATYLFASRDTCDLFLDIYEPAEGSETSIDGVCKPTVLFMFGGGFIMGARDEDCYMPWFKLLTDAGYRVVSIDYRLGLKGVGNVTISKVDKLENAINIAVEDLYSATKFLIDNAETLSIDPSNIVISGSSAGAISVMQGEWCLANGSSLASELPEGFDYAGVMSFSGAIFSKQGKIRYDREPAPVLMFHGTADKIVNYNQIWFFNLRFAGANVIEKSLRKGGYNYRIYRFRDNMHEIASSMVRNFSVEMDFIETNVMRGERRIVDAMVSDDTIEHSKYSNSTKDLYKDNN